LIVSVWIRNPDEQYSDCKGFLEKGFFPKSKITVEAEKLAEKFKERDKNHLPDSPDAQNKKWISNPKFLSISIILWRDLDASIEEIRKYLSLQKVYVSTHALRTIFKHEENRIYIENYFRENIYDLNNIEYLHEAKSFHDNYKEKNTERSGRVGAKRKWIKKRMNETDLAALFGIEPVETRQWMISRRALALAYVMFGKSFSYIKIAEYIQKFYGIKTTEDSIKNGMRKLYKRKTILGESNITVFIREYKNQISDDEKNIARKHLEELYNKFH
jgi:DNA-binding transcriptional MerR regulator